MFVFAARGTEDVYQKLKHGHCDVRADQRDEQLTDGLVPLGWSSVDKEKCASLARRNAFGIYATYIHLVVETDDRRPCIDPGEP